MKRAPNRHGKITKAVFAGLKAGHSPAQIMQTLNAEGISTSLGTIYVTANLIRKKTGKKVPGFNEIRAEQRRQKLLVATRAILDNPLRTNKQLATETGLDESFIAITKRWLRKKGVDISTVHSVRKSFVPYTLQQQQWVTENIEHITLAIQIGVNRRRMSKERAEEFKGFVYEQLPKIINRHKAGLDAQLVDYVKYCITNYLPREFNRQNIAREMKLNTSEARDLIALLRATSDARRISTAKAARELKIQLPRAKKLMERYKEFAERQPTRTEFRH